MSYATSSRTTDPNQEDPFVQWMEELTNVHIDFIVIASSDKETKINLMFAGGEYPDFMSGALLSESQIMSYGAAGILAPLNGYMTEEYMPNFVLGMKELYPELKTALTLEDGNIYVLPNAEPNWYDTYAGIYVNRQWLEKLGMPMPSTLDAFTQMLVSFKENDMNENGDVNDEIPLAFRTGRYGISSWFGVSDGVIFADGQAIYCPATEGWREYAQYMNQLWNLGVMDVEAYTQDQSTFNAKGAQATTIYGAVLDSSVSYFTTPDKYELYEIMLPVQTGSARSGVIKQRVSNTYFNLRQAQIFSSCQDIETLVRWFDNLYDPYYGQIATKGYLNGILVETEDGKLAFCDDKDVPSQYTNQTDWMTKTHFQQWPIYRSKYYDEYFTTTGTVYYLKVLSETLEDYFINEVMPYGFTYESEKAVYDEYLTDIKKYVNERFVLWATGERNVDADWDEYLATLERLGIGELTAAYQAQYDRLSAID